jgi:metal-responsive CopG/Arc/MetJ family transcriptional regulator
MAMAKVMITMPSEFLKQVDKAAAGEQRTRSEFIREAIRAYIAENAAGKSPARLRAPGVRAAVALQDRSREQLRGTKFDSVALVRKMRGPLKW